MSETLKNTLIAELINLIGGDGNTDVYLGRQTPSRRRWLHLPSKNADYDRFPVIYKRAGNGSQAVTHDPVTDPHKN